MLVTQSTFKKDGKNFAQYAYKSGKAFYTLFSKKS